MKVNIFPLVSCLHNQNKINENTQKLLNELINISDINFNPIIQYEQSYMYYRYLTQAVEYKIKCKEYEKLTSKEGRPERRVD